MIGMRIFVAGCLLLLTIGAFIAPSAEPSALDKSTLEAYVRHLLLWGPQISVEISEPQPSKIEGFHLVKVIGKAGPATQEQEFYVSADGSQILRGIVYDVAKNPFHEDYEAIDTANAPSLGTPGAPVRMVVYTDFQCPYCREEAQMLRQNLIQTFPEQVRLYFKDFPLESIHPWAKKAAVAGRCIYNQSEDEFWSYHDWVFEHQREITPDKVRNKILEYAGNRPALDVLKLTGCMDKGEAAEVVAASVAEARELQVNSTPTLFINGRRISSQLPWPNLKQVIDFEIGYQARTMNAGDQDCCAVKLPTALSQ